jgi:hypothetical protein
VGGNAFKEVNQLKPGANDGWPRAEGFSTNAAFTQPLHDHPPLVGQSIVEGVFFPKSRVVESKSGVVEHWSDRVGRGGTVNTPS